VVFVACVLRPPIYAPATGSAPARGSRSVLCLLAYAGLLHHLVVFHFPALSVVANPTVMMAHEALLYRDAMGCMPDVTDTSTWGPSWKRDGERPEEAGSISYEVFRRINPAHYTCTFVKNINAMLYARGLTLNARDTALTVVRLRKGVKYHRSYVCLILDDRVVAPWTRSIHCIMTTPPLAEMANPEGPTKLQLPTSRNNRWSIDGHLLGWYEVEHSSFSSVHRGYQYLPTPL